MSNAALSTATFDDDEVLPVARGGSAEVKPTNLPDTSSDVDFGDEDAMAMEGLEQLKPAKGQVIRFALLTDMVKAKVGWLHFIQSGDKKTAVKCHSVRDKKGNILGEPGICCAKLNADDDQKAQCNFAVLALRYKNADPTTGKYSKDVKTGEMPPIQWELGWVKLSKPGFRTVSKLIFEGEEAHEFDIVISVKTNGIGYEYNRATKGNARFRSNPELVAEVKEAVKPYLDGVMLGKRLGRVLSETDLKALLAGGAVKAGSGKNTLDEI